MRVGELLVGANVITSDQLEHALREQVMCGARVGTSLVELGYIDLDGLSNALGYQRGMPAALAVHFDRAERDVQLLLSPNLAEQYACVPLRRVGKRAVAVAVATPVDKRATAIIADELGIEPSRAIMAIAPELRIRYALERVYNIQRPQRFLRAPGAPRSLPKHVDLGGETLPIDPGSVEPETPGGERRRYVQSIELPPHSLTARQQTPRAVESVVPLKPPHRGGHAGQAGGSELLHHSSAPAVAGTALRAGEKSTDESAALASIRAAADRKRIAKLVIDALVHLEPAAEVVLLLTRRGNVAVGWATYCRDGRELEPLAVPLDLPSWVAAAFRRCEIPNTPQPIDRGLLTTCGLDRGEIVAEPIDANGHVVAALAVAGVGRPERATIAALAAAAGDGLARLMREAIAQAPH